MKYLTSFVLAGIFSISASAQNGFYGAASAGAGMGNMKSDITYHDQQGTTVSQSVVSSYNARLTLGYQYKNWRVQMGLQYLKTGYQLNNLLFGTDFDPGLTTLSFSTGKYKMTYDHFGIPVQIGYVIAPTKKLSLTPYLGVLTTYNTGATSVIHETGKETVNNWSKEAFDKRYNRLSVWGTAALYLEYKLSNKVSLFGGPSLQYMLSNFNKVSGSQRNYNISLDLGVKIKL